MTPSSPTINHRFAGLFALGWIAWGLILFILALLGLFVPILIGGFLVLIALGLFLFARRAAWYIVPGHELFFVVILLASIVTIHTSLSEPTIFSGRDQGSISEAAIRLAQNHRVTFSTPTSELFFSAYGQGKALNFPGFYYASDGALTPQFPLPYIAWLGGFYALFGMIGITVANAVLLFLFLLSAYAFCRRFTSPRFSFLFLVLLLTSFAIPWFFKFTLSETMAMALLWSALFFIVTLQSLPVKNTPDETENNFFFTATVATLLLLFFTRIEGVIFVVLAAAVFLAHAPLRTFLRRNSFWRILFPLAIAAIVFLLSVKTNIPFYKTMAKALLHAAPGEGDATPIAFFAHMRILTLYGITPLLLAGLGGIGYCIATKRFFFLLPLVITLPTFLYLINPQISPDHPWMLRRYVVSVIPVAAFFATIALSALFRRGMKEKIAGALLILLLVGINLRATAPIITFAEHRTLPIQIERLLARFSSDDLILVDRAATGDGWAMLTGPGQFLYNRNTVYFFNPSDLAKIDRARFEKTYLLVPDSTETSYMQSAIGPLLRFRETYALTTSRLEYLSTEDSLRLPHTVTITTTGKIFEIE